MICKNYNPVETRLIASLRRADFTNDLGLLYFVYFVYFFAFYDHYLMFFLENNQIIQFKDYQKEPYLSISHDDYRFVNNYICIDSRVVYFFTSS
ncbi:hypothetical protein RIVM261_015400 [Rivularia sp. IAM M-261]|nr:hypothetical protein RIVM261_015400 [Rivularia sp. IAM M-261]